MTQQDTIGEIVPGWKPPTLPHRKTMSGRYVTLEPLDADKHAAALFDAFDGHDALWRYMPYGPFQSAAAYHRWVKETVANPAHLFLALRDCSSGRPFGVASYLRMQPIDGSIEVGNICIAPSGQRSRAFTEAMWLMMRNAFMLGYRRYEWKCNALNIPSRRAAQRLGFSFEGVFRQATVTKGRNRDTAWFAMIDSEWPALSEVFDTWLAPANFDDAGQQLERLSDMTRLVRVASDPVL